MAILRKLIFSAVVSSGVISLLTLTGCASTPPVEPEPVVVAPIIEEPIVEEVIVEEPVVEEVVVVEEPPREKSYTVNKGDNLWNIAGRFDIYGEAYQWPLIYKNNQAQIDDADLIYPGQVLSIKLDPSSFEIQRAIEHAKNRGPWSLGVVEPTDRAYLANN